MPDSITVVILEDQVLVLDALTQLLNREPDICVVAGAADGETGLVLVDQYRPDVVLVDIEMPRLDGLAVAATLHRQCPATAVAILTTFGRPGYLQQALAAGARGFLLKAQPVADLARSIRRLAAGERVIDSDLALAALTEASTRFRHASKTFSAAPKPGKTWRPSPMRFILPPARSAIISPRRSKSSTPTTGSRRFAWPASGAGSDAAFGRNG
jgi:two-component system response regulator DesR